MPLLKIAWNYTQFQCVCKEIVLSPGVSPVRGKQYIIDYLPEYKKKFFEEPLNSLNNFQEWC